MCQSFCAQNADRGCHPAVFDDGLIGRTMHRLLDSYLVAAQIAMLLALGCSSVPPHPKVDALEQGFSGRMARAHLTSLEGLSPRLPGSPADQIARAYLAREFRRVGAKSRVLVEGGRHHLIADLEGDSDDVILLVAAYPALRSGRWIDDSGAALLLELARVIGSTRPPYTLVFALAETPPAPLPLPPSDEAPGGASTGAVPPSWQPVLTPSDARQRLLEAGHSLARGIEAEGRASGVRAVIVFDTSAAAGQQRVARDLRSHPEFRRLFWESAAALGLGSMFPPGGDWSAPDSLHLGFRERSMDRVLALVHVGGIDDGSENAPRMFDSMGAVSLDALSKLMRRFEKVDAFGR